MLLFVLEFLGTTELLVILVVALVLFGPRKLPELGRMLGKSLAEFKRQTDDFKRTWEREVELDKLTRDVRIDEEVREAREALDVNYTPPALEPAVAEGVAADFEGQTIARGARPHAETWTDAQGLTTEGAHASNGETDAPGGVRYAPAEVEGETADPPSHAGGAAADEQSNAAAGEPSNVTADAGASKVS